jgi:hypothetical protein
VIRFLFCPLIGRGGRTRCCGKNNDQQQGPAHDWLILLVRMLARPAIAAK